MNFAILGCGAISRIHALAINDIDNANLYGVFDYDFSKASKMAKEYECKVFSSLEEMLGDDNVDIVNICLPSGLHAEAINKIANAKKHIIVEKPIAITREQLRLVEESIHRNEVKIESISQLRFTNAIKEVKQAIEEGRLGKLLTIDSNMKFYRNDEYYKNGGWRGTYQMDGGGALMNQGIHGIDLMIYLMGDFDNVSATCKTIGHNIETEDIAYLYIEFKNGALGSAICSTISKPGYPRRIEITGTKGTVIIEEDSIVSWDIEGEERKCEKSSTNCGSTPNIDNYEYHKYQFEDLIHAIDKNLNTLIDEKEASKSVNLILSAYESSRLNGKKIKNENN